MSRLLVGIETGGTKIVCAAAPEGDPRRILSRSSVATGEPDTTLAAVGDFIRTLDGEIAGVGIAAFGPLDLDPASPAYGSITSTPKAGWDGVDVLGRIRDAAAGAPARITTDVTGAALGELQWGAAQGASDVAYVTVGTGVGAGLIAGGRVLVGTGWPEIAHLPVARHPDDTFAGSCRFHGDCLEGVASGPAVRARNGIDTQELDAAARAKSNEITAFYLAQLAATLYFTLGIELIVFGGGVLKTPGLIEALQEAAAVRVGPAGARGSSRDLAIARTELDGEAGLYGSLLLAEQAAAG
ncbi:ROK family protein [Microbacterium binotii]|uniref:ROK family protein n=1 Tax=Microbacterium binotii TaxID=462710 RepID=UPI001F219280|nr:ROK family protein [Microbacterium binotii]UIN30528.1 ROK family protein [Microbacterium binotii]